MYEEIFYDKKDGSFWDKETGVDLNIKTTPNCYGYAYIIYNKKYIALYRVIYYKEYSKEIPHNICVKYIDGNSNNLKYDNILFENKWEDNCQICGKLYIKNVKNQKFCSTDCLNINVEKTVAGDRLSILYKYTEKANKKYGIHQDKIIKGSHIR